MVLLVCLLLVGGATGCSEGEGGLPARMPDVEGETVADAVEELQGEGFTEILLFDAEDHAADPWDGLFAEDEEVAMTLPEPRDDAAEPVLLWIGEHPEVPGNVSPEAWYYPHGERIAQRGTDPCLTCHERDFCGACHEERLEATDELLSADPAAAPGVEGAVTSATGESGVTAENHGQGWFQVEIGLQAEDVREASAVAREAAVGLFPAAFEAEQDAEIIVVQWKSPDGEILVEIGYSRYTYEQHDWSDMDPLYIAWTADRYAVPSQ
jgi:hypothetical protein